VGAPAGRRRTTGVHDPLGIFRTPHNAPPLLDQRGPPLRIVFLAAAPQGQVALDYEKEEEAILRATVKLKGAQLFTAELGTCEELDELLRRVKPHIVHLSGHGVVGSDGVGRFVFEDEAGMADPRDAKHLAALFEKRHVPCVFLNGCQTAQAAVAGLCQSLTSAGVPLVLGWAASVADERATAFAETFYRELLGGEPVPAAVALARLRIQHEGIHPPVAGDDEHEELTFLLPQLYAARPVEVLFDRHAPAEDFDGIATRYELLSGDMAGLREGFVGRRREQQRLMPALRDGDITFLLLHGVGGQGKSTLATRLVGRLRSSGFDVRVVKTARQSDETAGNCAVRASDQIVKEMSLAATKLGKPEIGKALGSEDEPLARRLLLAGEALKDLKCVLVLDNFEDVLEPGPDGTWRIADVGLAEFYSRVQTQLTAAEGGRVVVTSRYLPAGTNDRLQAVHVLRGLADFKDYEFFKLLRRDEIVARRIGAGELPIPLLDELYRFAGGTPRFLERLRALLRTLPAKQLEDALEAGSNTLVKERDQYLQDHCGPQLWALLSSDARSLLSRLAVSEHPLPADALAGLTGLGAGSLSTAVKQGIEFGLLQVLEDTDAPRLHLPPGVWRTWLAEQLTDAERKAAHGILAGFWRTVFEKDRGPELRVTIVNGLQACRTHGKEAGDPAQWHWASYVLAALWQRIAEWRAARAVLDEIPESERDAGVWHQLATIDLREGNYAAAREKSGKSLAIKQQIGDRAGEAANWHNLASIDANEGNYAAAREKFGKSLAMRQQIGDRAGEAATWHQLATIDLNEGNYAAAREKFGKALAIIQQIGDRAGEAATWHQLGFVAAEEHHLAPAAKLVGLSFLIKQAIGQGDARSALESFLGVCSRLGLTEARGRSLLEEIGKSYERDRGRALLKEAFPDWP
jgi:tetratricopeptide (TPR) repeat protein